MTNSSVATTPVTNGTAAAGNLPISKSQANLIGLAGGNLANEVAEGSKKISRKISSTSLYEESTQCSQVSILPNVQRFIGAINNMTQVVMVPSKLYDFEAEESDTKSVSSEDSSTQIGLSLDTSSKSSSDQDPAGQSQQQQLTQFDNYRMLIQAREQLLWGSVLPTGGEEPVTTPLGAQFNNSLKQMNTLLGQLADMADMLTQKYKNHYEG